MATPKLQRRICKRPNQNQAADLPRLACSGRATAMVEQTRQEHGVLPITPNQPSLAKAKGRAAEMNSGWEKPPSVALSACGFH